MYMDGSVFEGGIQMGGNFVYFTGIVMGVYLKLVCMGSKNRFLVVSPSVLLQNPERHLPTEK